MRDATSQPNSGGASPRIMKMMGLKKQTKFTRQDFSEASGDRHRIKVIFWSTAHQNMILLFSSLKTLITMCYLTVSDAFSL